MVIALVWILNKNTAQADESSKNLGESLSLYRVNSMTSHQSSKADFRRMLPAKVTRIVDGDTVIVQIEIGRAHV